MSNNLQANPLSLTTAMTTGLKGYLGPKYFPVSSNGRFRVKRVVWLGSVTNGDTATVTDANVDVLATFAAVTADLGIPQPQAVDQLVTDVQLTQISSGTILIYIEQE
jgi:hypothetical protein